MIYIVIIIQVYIIIINNIKFIIANTKIIISIIIFNTICYYYLILILEYILRNLEKNIIF